MKNFKPPNGFEIAFPHMGDAFQPIEPLPPSADALPIKCAADFSGKNVPPRSFLVEPLIPDRTVTMLTGDGGVGKSKLVSQLAIAVAMGSEWIGTHPKRGPVLFLSAEDDEDEIHRRLSEICEASGFDLADLTDLHLVLLAGQDAVLGAPSQRSGAVQGTPLWRKLREAVAEIGPVLIILDTLADIFGGNEIVRTEARQFIGLLRGLAIEERCAVVLLAHPSLSGIASGRGSSGSTAWVNSVRSHLYLDRPTDDHTGAEVFSDVRFLRTRKANYSAAGGLIRLRYSDDGVFVRDEDGTSPAKLMSDAEAERVFLDLLAKFTTQGRDVSPNRSQSYAPTVFAKHPAGAGIHPRAFASAMERLLDGGRIEVEITGPPSRRHSRLVIVQEDTLE
jgi:RecA-family ATPase